MSHPEPRQIAAWRGDLTHEEVANLVGVTAKQWALWEVGLNQMPVRFWRRISKAPEPAKPPPPPKPTHAPTTSTVKALRQSYGCRRYQIAQLVGVHPKTWGKWEKTCPPSPLKWGRVLEALKNQPKLEINMETESKTQTNADPANVRMYREAAGYDRKGAASLVNVTEHTWKAWELGQRPMKQSLLDEWAAKATAIANTPTTTGAAYFAPESDHSPTPPRAEIKPLYFRPQGENAPTELPGITVVGDDMTPEQEAEMERDLMTPVMYDPRNPKSVQDALKAEIGDQDALRVAAGKRALELAQRDQKLLEED